MKIKNSINRRMRAAFTLIEMIGVLAVIAILASLLVPKIFNAINSARVNNTIVSYNTVKTAVMDHYAKYGALDKTTNNASISTPNTGYDSVLLTEGLIDKPYSVKIGTNSFVQMQAATNSAYLLDGTNNAMSGATLVVEAVIQGVSASDAKDINDALDGDKTPFIWANPDTKGRVKYDGTNVTIYVTHR